MSHLIDKEKIEVGFTDKYRKSFKGTGRNLKERAKSQRRFEKRYDRIDWSGK